MNIHDLFADLRRQVNAIVIGKDVSSIKQTSLQKLCDLIQRCHQEFISGESETAVEECRNLDAINFIFYPILNAARTAAQFNLDFIHWGNLQQCTNMLLSKMLRHSLCRTTPSYQLLEAAVQPAFMPCLLESFAVLQQSLGQNYSLHRVQGMSSLLVPMCTLAHDRPELGSELAARFVHSPSLQQYLVDAIALAVDRLRYLQHQVRPGAPGGARPPQALPDDVGELWKTVQTSALVAHQVLRPGVAAEMICSPYGPWVLQALAQMVHGALVLVLESLQLSSCEGPAASARSFAITCVRNNLQLVCSVLEVFVSNQGSTSGPNPMPAACLASLLRTFLAALQVLQHPKWPAAMQEGEPELLLLPFAVEGITLCLDSCGQADSQQQVASTSREVAAAVHRGIIQRANVPSLLEGCIRAMRDEDSLFRLLKLWSSGVQRGLWSPAHGHSSMLITLRVLAANRMSQGDQLVTQRVCAALLASTAQQMPPPEAAQQQRCRRQRQVPWGPEVQGALVSGIMSKGERSADGSSNVQVFEAPNSWEGVRAAAEACELAAPAMSVVLRRVWWGLLQRYASEARQARAAGASGGDGDGIEAVAARSPYPDEYLQGLIQQGQGQALSLLMLMGATLRFCSVAGSASARDAKLCAYLNGNTFLIELALRLWPLACSYSREGQQPEQPQHQPACWLGCSPEGWLLPALAVESLHCMFNAPPALQLADEMNQALDHTLQLWSGMWQELVARTRRLTQLSAAAKDGASSGASQEAAAKAALAAARGLCRWLQPLLTPMFGVSILERCARAVLCHTSLGGSVPPFPRWCGSERGTLLPLLLLPEAAAQLLRQAVQQLGSRWCGDEEEVTSALQGVRDALLALWRAWFTSPASQLMADFSVAVLRKASEMGNGPGLDYEVDGLVYALVKGEQPPTLSADGAMLAAVNALHQLEKAVAAVYELPLVKAAVARAEVEGGWEAGLAQLPPEQHRGCFNPGCTNLGAGQRHADQKLFLCGSCCCAAYCSKECQRAACRQHQRSCGHLLQLVADKRGSAGPVVL